LTINLKGKNGVFCCFFGLFFVSLIYNQTLKNMKQKTNYDVRPIIEAFEELTNYYGNSFRYRTETYWTGYHSLKAECYLNGKRKEFWFASPESEPTLKENEYWLVYYYELPSTSSIPNRGDKSKLKNKLIDLLEDELNGLK
jgi:hypothetical protein